MTGNLPRVASLRLPFWARLTIVVFAIAAACLGLVTLHSTTSHAQVASHSHEGATGIHQHAATMTSETGASTDTGGLNGASGLLAGCEGCALGTVTATTGTLLLLLSAIFMLAQTPGIFARLIDRGRSVVLTAAGLPRSVITPPPLVLGISRT